MSLGTATSPPSARTDSPARSVAQTRPLSTTARGPHQSAQLLSALLASSGVACHSLGNSYPSRPHPISSPPASQLGPDHRIPLRVDHSGRWQRIFYHGLHSLEFAILMKWPRLRDTLVDGLSLLGLAMCITACALAWRSVFPNKRRHRPARSHGCPQLPRRASPAPRPSHDIVTGVDGK